MNEKLHLTSHGGDIYSARPLKCASEIIDFSANINPLGMPTEVRNAIIENINSYECYPDPLCRELRAAIASSENTAVDNILCGNGAADIIFRIAIGLKPKRALLLAPTFCEYEQALSTVACDISYYNLDEKSGFCLDEGILEAITADFDILFICNPNNPTGVAAKRELMLKILKKCKACSVTLVVDECFIDFLRNEKSYSIKDKICEYDNLIIIKAFTKIYAMAGIRLGFMLCANPSVHLAAIGCAQSWSVSTIASKCGIAALSQVKYVEQTKKMIAQNRRYLMEELTKLGFVTCNSMANYILFYSPDVDLATKLVNYGILIRDCQNYHNLKRGYFRIAVNSQRDNEFLIKCMKKVMTE